MLLINMEKRVHWPKKKKPYLTNAEDEEEDEEEDKEEDEEEEEEEVHDDLFYHKKHIEGFEKYRDIADRIALLQIIGWRVNDDGHTRFKNHCPQEKEMKYYKIAIEGTKEEVKNATKKFNKKYSKGK